MRIVRRLRRVFGLPTRNRCCRKPSNLGELQQYGRPELGITFRRCQVCGSRHFEATAEPGQIGLRFP
jgi:hypothetical protein